MHGSAGCQSVSDLERRYIYIYTKHATGGAKLAFAAVCGPFRGASGADTFYHHLIQSAVKAVTVLR